ncbi:MAG: hypothetical protein AAGJ81_12840 [Verrucomicrobiota bacterium]
MRLLCLVLHLSADSRSPDTDWKRLRSPLPFLYLMVSIRVFRRTVCHEQRVLSLNPQIAFISQADDLFGASRYSNLIGLPWSPSGLDDFHVGHSIREGKVLFPAPVATPIRSDSVLFVHTVGHSLSTLAHSSNYRSETDCVRLYFPNRKVKASLGFAVGSRLGTAYLTLPLGHRSPPNSAIVVIRKGTTLFAGVGDICLLLSFTRRLTVQPEGYS